MSDDKKDQKPNEIMEKAGNPFAAAAGKAKQVKQRMGRNVSRAFGKSEDNDMHDVHVSAYKLRDHHVEIKSNRAGSSHEAHLYPKGATSDTHNESDVLHVSGPHKTAIDASDAAHKWSRDNANKPMAKAEKKPEIVNGEVKNLDLKSIPEKNKLPGWDYGKNKPSLKKASHDDIESSDRRHKSPMTHYSKLNDKQKDQAKRMYPHQTPVSEHVGHNKPISHENYHYQVNSKGDLSGSRHLSQKGHHEGKLSNLKDMKKPNLTKAEPKGDQHHTVAWVEGGEAKSKHFPKQPHEGHMKAVDSFHRELTNKGIKNIEHYPVGYQDEE